MPPGPTFGHVLCVSPRPNYEFAPSFLLQNLYAALAAARHGIERFASTGYTILENGARRRGAVHVCTVGVIHGWAVAASSNLTIVD